MKVAVKPIAIIAVLAIAVGGFVLATQWDDGPQAQQARSGTRPVAQQDAPLVDIVMPDDLGAMAQIGAGAFNATCASCHGENAVGRNGAGPPLIHKIYEPSHHGDGAFHLAVQNGVRAHHWGFGDMPPQTGLTRAEVDAIVAFVRELQAENGIN